MELVVHAVPSLKGQHPILPCLPLNTTLLSVKNPEAMAAIGCFESPRRRRAPRFRSFSIVRQPCERFLSAFTYIRTIAPDAEYLWYRRKLEWIIQGFMLFLQGAVR